MSFGDTVRTVTHGGFVSALAFSPDGADIVTADDAGVVKVSPVTGQDTRFERDLGNYVPGVAVSPDGTLVAAAGRTTLAVHDRVTGARRWDLAAGQVDQFFHLAGFSPDGATAAVATTRTVVVANALTGSTVRTITLDEDVTALAWGDGPTRLAVGTSDFGAQGGSIRVFDAAADTETGRALQAGGNTVVTWSPVRPVLVGYSIADDGQIVALDARTGQPAWTTDVGMISTAAVERTGRWAVCGLTDGSVRVLYAAVGVERHRLSFPGGVAVLAGGRWAAAAISGLVLLLDPSTGASFQEFPFDDVTLTAFSPDDRYLAVASGPTVTVLDVTP